MKKILFMLVAAIVTMSANAEMAPRKLKKAAIPAGYNLVELGYAPSFAGGFTSHGLEVGYMRGIRLVKDMPMYIEVGGNLQFNSGGGSEDVIGALGSWASMASGVVDDIDDSGNVLRLNIAGNWTWRFTLGSKKQIKLSPYIVPNFGIGLYMPEGSRYFIFGFNEGVNFTYKHINAAFGVTEDFMSMSKADGAASAVSLKIAVGYAF